MTWNPTKPESTDLLREFPSTMTAQAVSFRQAMEQHFFWTASSGASAGQPLLSDGSPGPGVARAFFDVTSNVSAAPGGKLYITSDGTLRLFGLTPSAVSQPLLGSRQALIAYSSGVSAPTSAQTIKAGTRMLIQVGSDSGKSVNSISVQTFSVTFPTPYTASAPALVELNSFYSNATQPYFCGLASSTKTGFVYTLTYGGTEPNPANGGITWYSEGTVTL